MGTTGATVADAGRRAARRQRRVDASARRVHDRLAADPTRYRSAPSSTGALVLAVAVLAAAAALVVLLGWLTWRYAGEGLLGVPLALAWLLLLYVAAPRRDRPPEGSVVLSPEDQPGVHTLVSHLAHAVGVRPPRRVVLTTELNASVGARGWRGRPDLHLGLPLWTLHGQDQRTAILSHELGHLRGRHHVHARLVHAATVLLARTAFVFGPDETFEVFDIGTGTSLAPPSMVALVQSVLTAPFRVLHALLRRLQLASSQHQEYLADRRAAEIVGTSAMRQALATDALGIWTRVAAGARRGEDPFDLLEAVEPPTAAAVAAYERWAETRAVREDATHPPDHLRLSLLATYHLLPGPEAPSGALVHAADVELRALRPALRAQLTHELRGPWA